MKTVPYTHLSILFAERVFPEQEGLDESQTRYLLSYFREAFNEVWDKFDWDFTLAIEKVAVSSQIIPNSDLGDAEDCRILQVWDKNPVLDITAKNLSFKILGEDIYLSKEIEGNVYIKYKKNLDFVSDKTPIPICLVSMILSLCIFHYENGQNRFDVAQGFFANYERYAQLEISKQSLASIRANAINTRNIQ